MTIDPKDAALSLSEIERTQQRTLEALYYSGASAILILWGVLSILGYLVHLAVPRSEQIGWVAITLFGVSGTFLISYTRARAGHRMRSWRLHQALLALTAYGIAFVLVLGPLTSRQLGAFWPMLYMLGFVLAGLWVGRFFILCGATVTLLLVLGYFFAGSWFPLWTAVVVGGGLIAGGVWLRQASR